jgi:hypothetical protein
MGGNWTAGDCLTGRLSDYPIISFEELINYLTGEEKGMEYY